MMESLSDKSAGPQSRRSHDKDTELKPSEKALDKATHDILPETDSVMRPPPPVADRRKYLRVPIELQVESVSIYHNDSIRGKAKIKNIGGGGALLETDLDITEDDTILINQIKISPEIILKDIFAKVTHAHGGQGFNLVGVEFIYLDIEERQSIQKYIDEELK
jgi:c-di-GMP-binding flagellar brake protein YcgR